MEPDQAAKLGQRIRLRRQQLGLSIRDIADRAGMNLATVSRIEQGRFAAPRPDKLARIAKVLGLDTVELFSLANYAVPVDLPSFQPYLRTRYGDMPAAAIDELNRAFARITKKHGYDPDSRDDASPTEHHQLA